MDGNAARLRADVTLVVLRNGTFPLNGRLTFFFFFCERAGRKREIFLLQPEVFIIRRCAYMCIYASSIDGDELDGHFVHP